MTLFGLYSLPERGPDAIAAVPDRFVWSACVFAPLWALAKGLWLYLACWLGVALVLYGASMVIGDQGAIALYVVFALWTGFSAGSIEAAALRARGWIDHGDCVAIDTQAAEGVWINHFYGARR